MTMRSRWLVAVCVVALAAAAVAYSRSRPVPEPSESSGPAPANASASTPASEPPSSVAATCRHPYIPTRVGTELAYRIAGASGTTGMAFLTAESSSALGVETVWTLDISIDGGRSIRSTTPARCLTGRGAEEPWFSPSLGLFQTRGDRWLWPMSLDVGVEFGGALVLGMVAPTDGASDPAAAIAALAGVTEMRVERSHRVVEQVQLTVPAGEFLTWRVEFDETDTMGATETLGTGTMWVAADVGLVKSEMRIPAGGVSTWELESYELP